MSSSTSSSPNAPRRHTPPSETPLSPASIASDDDLAVHTAEDGFELRPLPRRDDDAGENERGRLLGNGDGSDEDTAEDEVLYDAFGDGGTGRRRHGQTQRKGILDYSLEEERKVVKKLDRWLVGCLGVLYMLRYVGGGRMAAMRMMRADMVHVASWTAAVCPLYPLARVLC